MKSFNCVINFFIKNKLISFCFLVLLVIGLITVPRIFAELQPVKSVEILSEKTNFNEKEAGSWKIDKSAKWVSRGIAEIKFDLDTVLKTNNKYTDILFVLDISGSMSGDKLSRVKADTTELITTLLSNSNNRAGIITFETNSSIVSDFTNSKDELLDKINNLSTGNMTNYYQALVNVDSLLKNYTKEKDRECVVLFLTDGYPNENTPNEVGQYNYLKNEYPFITINGIQYEMGGTVLDPVKKVSDNQYIADMETLNNVLFDASVTPVEYENFNITDYIDTDYFNVESDKDIKVSQGTFEFDKTSQKISWNIDNLKSGSKAQMTIKAKLKEEFIGEGGYYPTNKHEEINSKLEEVIEEIDSPKTPVLADNYKVIYEGNEPEGCKIEGVPEAKNHSVFDTVGISEVEPVCSGYQFKGWDITTKDVVQVNDDYFIMPGEDVVIKANWSKLSITKATEGTVKESLTLYKQVKDDANDSTKYAKKYPGLTDTFNGNEEVYYYYGAAANNNVIFGDYCWKIVRTTDTGGVKLLYNGVPSEDGKCANTGNASQLTKEQMNTSGVSVAFNKSSSSPADVGYMNNTRYTYNIKSMTSSQTILSNSSMSTSTSYYYSDNYEYRNSSYYMNTPTQYTWIDNYESLVGKYTCRSTSSSGYCSSLSYVVKAEENRMYYITISSGKGLSDSGYEETITFSDNINDNGNGTYTLSNPVTIEKKDWYTNYGSYKNYYTCGSNEVTCAGMRYTTSTSNSSITYVNRNAEYKYGNSFTWDGTNYTLVDTIDVKDLSQSEVLNNNHYTCFNSSGVCNELNYIYYIISGKLYYVKLNNGKSVEDALNEMLFNDDVNTNDSTIKTAIDYWYSNNMIQYTDYLEDTVWCNDRSMSNQSTNGWNPNGGSTSTSLYFKSNGNLSNLTCQNRNDRFSVNKENGNGALRYPVGLITRQEQGLSSYGGGSPLVSGNSYWGLSPGNFYSSGVYGSCGVRPAVSLRTGIEYMSGDGSVDTPYVIDMDS